MTCVISFLCVLIGLNLIEAQVVVNPPTGPIVGFQSPANSNFHFFLGIPYAEPPVGKRRFEDPVKKRSWTEPFGAFAFGNVCPQYNPGYIGDEDCLFLNVFTPIAPNPRNKLPVMVFIHGGSFMYNSGDLDPTPLLEKGVIVVSMNYRLGMLGFMNLNNSDISGNQGLKDQLLAMKWVNKNIKQFGGKKSQVTIFGQSAGAMSVHLHQLSQRPSHTDFYQRAIMMSGNALGINGLITSGRTVRDSERFVFDQHCDKSCNIKKCLQEVPAQEFAIVEIVPLNLTSELQLELIGQEMYLTAPSLDPNANKPFLPQLPLEILQNNLYKDIPTMMGVVENDGALFAAYYWQQLQELNDNFLDHGFRFLTFQSSAEKTSDDETKIQAIRDYYFGSNDISQANLDELLHLGNDLFKVPAIISLKYQSAFQQENIYFYELNHKPSISFSSVYGQPSGADTVDFGVSHGDDLQYLFKFPIPLLSPDDFLVREYMTTMWTDFAKTGDPGSGWTAYEPTGHTFMNINTTLSVEVQPQSCLDDVQFWQDIHWTQLEADAMA